MPWLFDLAEGCTKYSKISSMIENKNLYFIAIIPQDQTCEEITNFKKDLAARFNSSKALKVMPHITLKAPFQLSFIEHASLLNWFQNLYINEDPFKIELKNFAAFHNLNSPVIYVDPIINTALYVLQKEIIRSFKNSFPGNIHPVDLKFKPHVTIAYRDLSPEMFHLAWAEYKLKKYEAIFEVFAFHLLQHDKKKWNIIKTYSLQKRN